MLVHDNIASFSVANLPIVKVYAQRMGLVETILLGESMTAEMFNYYAIGRVLDRIYDYSLLDSFVRNAAPLANHLLFSSHLRRPAR